MSRRSGSSYLGLGIAGKRPYHDHYNGIGHYNDDEAYEQDMDVWKGKRKAVNNFFKGTFKALRSAPTSSAPRSAPTSSASMSASTSSAPRTTPTSSAQRTAPAWSAPNRALASTSSSPARPPTRHKKGEDIDIIKSSESQKTENVENNQVQQDRSTKNYSYSSQEKSLADLKERHIILQKRNDTIQQSIEKSSKKVILHRAEHITESDEDDSDSDVTFIKNIAHQAEQIGESDEYSDEFASTSWHPNIISNRDDQRNMVETSTEADGDDLDFSLDEEDNIPDFDKTVKKVPEVSKKSSAKTLSRIDLEKMLNTERLKNQMLQTELDQVQRDRSTKNYSYLSQQKSFTDLKEKNFSLQKKLDKTQEEISAQTEVILEKMETIDNLQKNSTEQSYLAICRENVDLKRSNKELEGINAVLSPAAKEIRKIRNSLIAKIQLGSRETDENEHENMLKLDILSLFQKYEKSVALHEKKLTTSCTQKDEKTEKIVSQANLDFRAINEQLNAEVEKLKAKIVRLKGKIKEHKNKACTESLTLQKLSELQEAIGTNRNEPDKIKALEDKLKDANETLLDCKTKLDLQKEMSRMYQKQQQQMMDILQIPQEDRSFAKVLNAVTAFQEAKAGIFTNTEEQNEIDLYENAERILQD